VTALNLGAYPIADLGGEILREILRGGHDAGARGGWCRVAGRAIRSTIPSQSTGWPDGTVHPDRVGAQLDER